MSVEEINVRVFGVGGSPNYFYIKRKTKLKRLMDKYCDCIRVPRLEFTFKFGESRINDEDTAESLDMHEGDEIRAFLKPKRMIIKVINSDGDVMRFNLDRMTVLIKLMGFYCERNKITTSKARFMYRGSRILCQDTPLSLNMKESDTIEFYLAQEESEESDRWV